MLESAADCIELVKLLYCSKFSFETLSNDSDLQSALNLPQSAFLNAYLATSTSSLIGGSSLLIKMGQWSLPRESVDTFQLHFKARLCEAKLRSIGLRPPLCLM